MVTNQGNEGEKNKFEGFIEQLNLINEARIRESGKFEQRIFYVITALFGFSIALAQFIKEPNQLLFLLLTWIFNILALISHLLTYFFADKDLVFKRDIIWNNVPDEESFKIFFDKKKSVWAKLVSVFNIVSPILFILAIVCLLVFSFYNLGF